MKQYSSLSQIIDNYDTLFVDLWGVIHDGIIAYPGVHDALASLKTAGKKIIFISNAPRRKHKAVAGLCKLGISDELYDNLITSGEIVFEYFSGKNCNNNDNKFAIIGPDRDADLLDGTSYQRIADINSANFMVVTGFDNDDSTLAEKQPFLDAAIKLNLPLICANPDLIVVRQNGKEALCAGVIAAQYEKMGGLVTQFGKPYSHIYERALAIAGNPEKTRIAAIGDSLITDIKGANDFGIDSYFIPGGIFGAKLGIKHGQLPQEDKLLKLCESYDIFPTGILPEFV